MLTGLMMSGTSGDLLAIIRRLGLPDPVVCLDVGAIACVASSSTQNVLDMTTNDNDFYRGVSGSPGADDPTFNGTPGKLSSAEFYSFDGGDKLDEQTSGGLDTFSADYHKNNAVFTILSIPRIIASASIQALCGNADTTDANGIWFGVNTDEKLNFICRGSSADALNITADNAVTGSLDRFLAVSIDESGGTGFFYDTGAYAQVSSADTFTATYSSPSISAAADDMSVGAAAAADYLASGGRVAGFIVWESALTKAQLDTFLYDAGKRWWGSDTSVWSDTLNADSAGGWGDYSIRQVIPASAISGPANKIKLTLEAPSGTGVQFDNVSIVPRSGATANGTTTPTELLFSGGSGVTISSGATEQSDELDFELSPGIDHLVVMDITTANNTLRRVTSGGGGDYFKAATNSYDQETVSGFSFSASNTYCAVDITGRIA